MSTRYVIGLGLPRSGTTSLAALLGGCTGASVTHEGTRHLMPWPPTKDATRPAVQFLKAKSGRYVGDVGYYWMPYLLPMYRVLPSLKAVALVRPFGEWWPSFRARVDEAVLTDNSGASRTQFPTINKATPKARAQAYYKRYVAMLVNLREEVPLAIHHTQSLNTPRRLLRASGIQRDDWTVTTHHCNQRHE